MVRESFISSTSVPEFVDRLTLGLERRVLSFELELTARCNNDCRHCYINLPAGDRAAQEKEFTLEQIGRIADQAVGLARISHKPDFFVGVDSPGTKIPGDFCLRTTKSSELKNHGAILYFFGP